MTPEEVRDSWDEWQVAGVERLPAAWDGKPRYHVVLVCGDRVRQETAGEPPPGWAVAEDDPSQVRPIGAPPGPYADRY